jgi:hypothetical protein
MAKEEKLRGGIVVIVGLLFLGFYYVLLSYGVGGDRDPTSEDVIAAFKAHSLDVASSMPIDEVERQTSVPRTYKEGMRFTIASLGPNRYGEGRGGRVLTFDSPKDMEPVQNYYERLGRADGRFFSHVYTKDLILLQIDGKLPKQKAEEYNAVLQKM